MNSAIGVTALLIISMSWQHEPPMFYKGWIREDHPDILMTVYDHIAEPHQPHITVGYLIRVCKKGHLRCPCHCLEHRRWTYFRAHLLSQGMWPAHYLAQEACAGTAFNEEYSVVSCSYGFTEVAPTSPIFALAAESNQ